MKLKRIKRQIGIFLSLSLYCAYALLLMMRTKILVTNYGSEVNAIFQTANQIFGYFVLIESGMSMAYQFKLYEPINNKSIERIAALFLGLKKSMKKVAIKMMLVLVFIAVVYPFIMDRVSISTMEARIMLFLLGLRVIIPYFVSMASKALLNVYDYRYLIDILDSLAYLAITLSELLALKLQLSIYVILLIGCVGNMIMGIIYAFLLWRLCGEIKGKTVKTDLEPEEMTKDIFFLKITGLLNTHIDTIILSIVDIMLVTPYQAYYTIVSYVSSVVNRIDENYRTKIGLKIQRKDSELYEYFQLFLSYHMAAAIFSVSMFALNINNLIYLWLGEKFVLSNFCVAMMSAYLIHLMTRDILYLVRDGAGLYKESKWLSLHEGITNLLLSLILVHHCGIEGILFATVFATYAMFIPSTSNLVYRVMNHKNTLWIDYAAVAVVSCLLIWGCQNKLNDVVSVSWGSFMVRLIKEGILCAVVSVAAVILLKWKYILKLFTKKRQRRYI